MKIVTAAIFTILKVNLIINILIIRPSFDDQIETKSGWNSFLKQNDSNNSAFKRGSKNWY